MRLTVRRRLRVASFAAALTAASALAVALAGNSADAATSATPATRPTITRTPPTGPVVAEGTYTWRTDNGTGCLGYDAEHRGQAWQLDCRADGDYNPGSDEDNQWRTVNVGGNNYELINAEKNQCLSVENSETYDNAAIFILDCHGFASQIWTAVPLPGRPAGYQLVNLNSQKCAAVSAGDRGPSDGPPYVIQWTCSPTDPAFRWSPFQLSNPGSAAHL